MRGIVIITTVGTEEQANLIAREIVARRQAACVNILPGVRSIYRWKGKICKDGELLLVVKTLEAEFEGVAATIRELHNYELPEILSFSVSHGERQFLEWIAECVDKQAAGADDDEEDEVAFADSDED
jgi:periplasmic divalent cation tolerance protein